MKRALLFAPYFLPRRRVGSMRPFRFAIHLREFGWEPTILTIQTKGQRLTEREAELLRGIEVVELEPPFDRTLRAESQLGAASQNGDGSARLRHLGDTLARAVDRHFPVDTWLPFFALKYPEIVRTVRRVQPDVLWSTGDPWSGLAVPVPLVRHTGLPWVADFRDPWTLCRVRTAGQAALTKAIDRFVERRIVETADAVLFQAQQTEQKYRQHYADLNLHTTTIYNSYDPDVFDDPVDPASAVPHAVDPAPALTLGFFGRFRAMSPASLIVDVLEEVQQRRPDLVADIRIYSFGPLNDADARYAAERGLRGNFRQRDAVPLEQTLSALGRFDLLLLSTDTRRDEIIPAKLLEYLAVGRPVLSLSRNPEVETILERTGTGFQLPPTDPAAVAALLIDALQAKRAGRPLPLPFAPHPEAIGRFEARATTQELATLFDTLT